ncbi:acyl transferase/acyl hydrolase/lysophospholipase [Amylocarpus encephaloides]|uniref:Patatin-like phospholipase domain-containing protein n=1 Tax=Amylocarpus encephaloides TaxID=45428 RepID=A0A9P7YDU4_9HELO|nr:acyl transferase/acyl hydrolase/lysophospholipase [Amylocarpus encephaloides]
MANLYRSTSRPAPNGQEGYDSSLLPDFEYEFLSYEDVIAFANALSAPESSEDLSSTTTSLGGSESRGSNANGLGGTIRSPSVASLQSGASCQPSGAGERRESIFITAQNDWAPVNPPRGSLRGGAKKSKVKGRSRKPRRSRDETREGYLYTLLKWPFLGVVGAWVVGLAFCYLLTRLYIWLYEHFVAWRGKRERLRRMLQSAKTYRDWVRAARDLDRYLGNDKWREDDTFAYYDSKTVKRVVGQLRKMRRRVESEEKRAANGSTIKKKAIEDLKVLVEACVKSNFVGIENSRLYSQTYYGTKNLVQEFIDEVEKGVRILVDTTLLGAEEKRHSFKRMHTNFGRTALCLSGGASFAYYHFGVTKALLDADLLPEVITGTSGGALVAALIATRTNEELKKLLVPALAGRIDACSEPFTVWFPRWWKTGARFDSLEWAKKCSWFTRGSMTFREAYERTGRILNVSCVPADPHSPTILTNYLTAPDCVIWSAVLASAAVPGILNPVVLMMKTPRGNLVPYSFGHKWKDGSLRTDIPLKALNVHFNVNFSIVSQVNPHINLFFFSSRGSVGQPVTHRRGRGWRGGFLGSATEQYLKLDLNKWLKVLRHLELLPRPLGQDWSEIWLQQFSGTITIWPRSITSDFWRILSDPNPKQLARMLHVGQQSAFPKLQFLANRMRVERMVERGRKETRVNVSRGSIGSILSEDDIRSLLKKGDESRKGMVTEEDTDLEGVLTGDEFEALSAEMAVEDEGLFMSKVEG